MIRILAFIAIIQAIKTFLSCLYHHSYKIAGNITSVINGIILIITPLLLEYNLLQVIIDFNVAYNLVDMVNASTVFRVHHIAVLIADYLILALKTTDEQFYIMTVYSLIEMSNIFVWYFYHKIQLESYKLSRNDMKIQLYWFAGFRVIASILMVNVCYYYSLYVELSIFMLVIAGSIFWSYGMYKKFAI